MAENNEQPPRRISRGRQKVAMVKMSNESNLQVTFSKRRAGLFKKASELCTLCGVEMAVVVFSPGKKVFSFGHPSVETILNRYAGTSRDPPISGSNSPPLHLIEAHRSVNMRDLNSQLAQVTAQVEAERRRGEEMNQQRREAVAAQKWWEAPVETMDDESHLRQLSRALDELRRAVSLQTDRVIIQTTAAAAAAATTVAMEIPPPFYVNGGGGGGDRSTGGQVVYYTNNNMNNGAGSSSYNNNNNNIGSYGRGFF